MAVDLATVPLEELMQKFASGGHKPGSGSAAALLGLISCALVKTVVGLSKSRGEYKDVWSALTEIEASVSNEIEPELWKAFGDDSKQFDKVISARRARDKEASPHQRWRHANKALNELYEANEIPLMVAENCLSLADHAISVFDIGFKSARRLIPPCQELRALSRSYISI